ncbi:MAG: hypothetical protein HGA22_11335, partial [Clostridiales bacterium]|nr:hypothetical protein [Clostridiales bacterium]
MLTGKNIRIRALEKRDLDLFYEWLGNKENMGCFMDVNLEYKEGFTERMELLLKAKDRLYTMIEDESGNPSGIMNYRETGSPATLEIGIL